MESGSEKRKPYKCDLCDKSFVLKYSLTSHVSIIHEEKKPFKCDRCDTTFAYKSVLDKHISSVHEE